VSSPAYPITVGAVILVASCFNATASTRSSALDTGDEFTCVFRGHGFGGVDPVGDLDPQEPVVVGDLDAAAATVPRASVAAPVLSATARQVGIVGQLDVMVVRAPRLVLGRRHAAKCAPLMAELWDASLTRFDRHDPAGRSRGVIAAKTGRPRRGHLRVDIGTLHSMLRAKNLRPLQRVTRRV
jgi:hypothetical protein